MECFDQAVQTAYDKRFNLPNPPNSPVATITARDKELFIRWDAGSENYNQPRYNWEGYNVYQAHRWPDHGPTCATYDRPNHITSDARWRRVRPHVAGPAGEGEAFGTDAGPSGTVNARGLCATSHSVDVERDVVREARVHSPIDLLLHGDEAYPSPGRVRSRCWSRHSVPITVVPAYARRGFSRPATTRAWRVVRETSWRPHRPTPGTRRMSFDRDQCSIRRDARRPATRSAQDQYGSSAVWFLAPPSAPRSTPSSNNCRTSRATRIHVVDGDPGQGADSFPLGELARVS